MSNSTAEIEEHLFGITSLQDTTDSINSRSPENYSEHSLQSDMNMKPFKLKGSSCTAEKVKARVTNGSKIVCPFSANFCSSN